MTHISDVFWRLSRCSVNTHPEATAADHSAKTRFKRGFSNAGKFLEWAYGAGSEYHEYRDGEDATELMRQSRLVRGSQGDYVKKYKALLTQGEPAPVSQGVVRYNGWDALHDIVTLNSESFFVGSFYLSIESTDGTTLTFDLWNTTSAGSFLRMYAPSWSGWNDVNWQRQTFPLSGNTYQHYHWSEPITE